MEGARAHDRTHRHDRHGFDEYGHLTPLRHEQIRERLNETGHWGATQQSELLARQLGHPDAAEIWAVLMWNARPSPALAAKLQRWLATGMPLGRAAAPEASPYAKVS
jgi:hypothetical protein